MTLNRPGSQGSCFMGGGSANASGTCSAACRGACRGTFVPIGGASFQFVRVFDAPGSDGLPEKPRVLLGEMVGVGRFELPTPCSRSRCATRLRYTPLAVEPWNIDGSERPS